MLVVQKNGWLNSADFFAVIDRPGRAPGFSEIAGSFEMHPPALILCTARAENISILQLDRLVLDRAKNSLRQARRRGPGLAPIYGGDQHSPPGRRVGTDFIEQQQRAGFWLEQDRIPTGVTLAGGLYAIGDFNWRGPMPSQLTRDPNPNIRIALTRPSKPRRHQAALGFGNGRCMTACERCAFENKLRLHKTRLCRGVRLREHA